VRMSAPLPVVAIGGIDAANTGAVVAAGSAGVAVPGAILKAADPRVATRTIREALSTKGNPG